MSDFLSFIRGIPIVTRVYVFVVFGVFVFRSWVSQYLYWDYELFRYNHEFWRLITPFFLARVEWRNELQTFLRIYFFLRLSKSLENGRFYGNVENYIYYAIIVWGVIHAISPLLSANAFFELFAAATIMSCSRWRPFTTSQLIVFQFKSMYHPYIMLFMEYIMGDSLLNASAAGFAGALVYSCLVDKSIAPLVGFVKIPFGYAEGKELVDTGSLEAPGWLKSVSSFFSTPPRRSEGRRLGEASTRSNLFTRPQTASTTSFTRNPPAKKEASFRGPGRRLGD